MNHNQNNMNHFWDLSLEILCLIDFENYFRDVSPAFEKVLGYTKNEVLGKLLTDFLHPDDLSATLTELKLHPLGHIARHFEHRYRRKDGSYIWLSWNAIPVVEERLIYAIARDITWRKQAEAALMRSEEKYRNLVELTNDYIWEINTEGICTYANPKIYDILGYKPEEVVGKTPFDLMPAEEAERVLPIFQEHVSQGSPIVSLEYFIYHKDGHLVALETSSVPFYNSEGVLQGYRGIDRDITERKKAEEVLKESEERFSQAFNSSAAGFTITALNDGTIIEANEAYLALTGYNREELIGHKTTEMGLWVNLKQREELVRRLKAEGKVHNQDVEVKTKNGKLVNTLFSMELIHRHGEDFALATALDITERKRVEAALARAKENLEIKVKERTAELTESEAKYRSVVDNASELIVVFQEGIKFINDMGLKIIGYSRKELLSRPFTDFIHPDDQAMMAERSKRRASGEAVINSYEFRIIHKDGSTRWLAVNAVLIQWEGKQATLGLMSDITERKLAQEALRLSEEQYRSLVDNANEGISVVQDGVNKLINKKGLEISGYSKGELTGNTFLELVHPDDRKTIMESYQKFIAGEAVQLNYEFRIIWKDGSTRWLQMNVANTTWEKRPAILTMFTDITEHQMIEQELKDYAQKITQVQEEERKRIAYELHDDTAQYLAILKLEIDSIIHSGKIRSAEILEKLKYLEKDAGRAVDDVRRYSHELRPGVLEHLGLVAALEQIIEDINKLKQLKVELTVEGEECTLSEEVKLGFFRISQEALNNCRKHSKSLEANVMLRFRKNRLEMVISDNGIGFDIQEARGCTGLKGSLGLISMEERAKLIGAKLKIESQSGQGTTVTVDKTL